MAEGIGHAAAGAVSTAALLEAGDHPALDKVYAVVEKLAVEQEIVHRAVSQLQADREQLEHDNADLHSRLLETSKQREALVGVLKEALSRSGLSVSSVLSGSSGHHRESVLSGSSGPVDGVLSSCTSSLDDDHHGRPASASTRAKAGLGPGHGREGDSDTQRGGRSRSSSRGRRTGTTERDKPSHNGDPYRDAATATGLHERHGDGGQATRDLHALAGCYGSSDADADHDHDCTASDCACSTSERASSSTTSTFEI